MEAELKLGSYKQQLNNIVEENNSDPHWVNHLLLGQERRMMVQWLRAWTALTEDLSLDPNTHAGGL